MDEPSNLVLPSFALCSLGASVRNLDCLPSGGIAAIWGRWLPSSVHSALDHLFHKPRSNFFELGATMGAIVPHTELYVL